MMGDIYRNYNLNPLRKCTSSCRSTEFSDILSWNISQRITKTIPINKKNRHKLCNEMGILFWVWEKVNGNWDNHMIRIPQWRKGRCRTNTSIKKWINSPEQDSESQSGIQVRKLTIWVRSFEIEKLFNRVYYVYQFIRIG